MPKRKSSSAGSILPADTRGDGPTIDPSLALEASDSEDSHYSGLESEPDTEEEEEVLGSGSEDGGSEVSTDEEEQPHDPWREAEDADTSDEEEYRNTVGNIPLRWYDDLPHIGYSVDGKQVLRPAKGDELDEFLSKMDAPDYWRTVQDKLSGREVVLTDEELDLIQKIQRSEFPSQTTSSYEDYVDHFTSEKQLHPLSDAPPPKSSFEPSKWERQRIGKLVHAIKMGWIKPHPQGGAKRPRFYMLWGGDSSEQADRGKGHMHIPAPKMKLPGHAESYNPPPEFLPTEEEAREWAESEAEDRKRNFLPHKYSHLRDVPSYPRFMQERFERCLDLYLCPRQRKMRVQVDPEDLIPKLPKPKDLQPFPTTQSIVYEGHSELVSSISVDHSGQWLASGSADGTVRLWEVASGRCVDTLPVGKGGVVGVAFSPAPTLSLLAIAVDQRVLVVNHGRADRLVVSATHSALSSYQQAASSSESSAAVWGECCLKEAINGVSVQHSKPVKQVVWHSRGDYLATVVEDAAGSGVLIHQLSKGRSQAPFKRTKGGAVQRVLFHPSRPFFFVATQTAVRVYNLAKQELARKLQTGVRWVSCMDIHGQGDNLIVGSFDKRLCWFDMDLSNKPYRVIRHHRQAIRSACFHAHFPLFASCSDDASVIVCHGRVFSDLMQNPLIVPVKVLKGHAIVNSLGVLDCKFHPTQPWLFTAGADKTIRLFT